MTKPTFENSFGMQDNAADCYNFVVLAAATKTAANITKFYVGQFFWFFLHRKPQVLSVCVKYQPFQMLLRKVNWINIAPQHKHSIRHKLKQKIFISLTATPLKRPKMLQLTCPTSK